MNLGTMNWHFNVNLFPYVFILWFCLNLCATNDQQSERSTLNPRNKDASVIYESRENLNYTMELLKNFVNQKIDPCYDFYDYACGKYLEEHPLSDRVFYENLEKEKIKANEKCLNDAIANGFNYANSSAVQKMFLYQNKISSYTDEQSMTPKVMLNEIKQFGGCKMFFDDWSENNFDFMNVLTKIYNLTKIPYLFDIKLTEAFYDTPSIHDISLSYVIDFPALMFPVDTVILNNNERHSFVQKIYANFFLNLTKEIYDGENLPNFNETYLEDQIHQIISFESNLSYFYAEKNIEVPMSLKNIILETFTFDEVTQLINVNRSTEYLKLFIDPNNKIPIQVTRPNIMKQLIDMYSIFFNDKELASNYFCVKYLFNNVKYTSKSVKSMAHKLLQNVPECKKDFYSFNPVQIMFPFVTDHMFYYNCFDQKLSKIINSLIKYTKEEMVSIIQNYENISETMKHMILYPLNETKIFIGGTNIAVNTSRLDVYYKSLDFDGNNFVWEIDRKIYEFEQRMLLKSMLILKTETYFRNTRAFHYEYRYNYELNAVYLPAASISVLNYRKAHSNLLDYAYLSNLIFQTLYTHIHKNVVYGHDFKANFASKKDAPMMSIAPRFLMAFKKYEASTNSAKSDFYDQLLYTFKYSHKVYLNFLENENITGLFYDTFPYSQLSQLYYTAFGMSYCIKAPFSHDALHGRIETKIVDKQMIYKFNKNLVQDANFLNTFQCTTKNVLNEYIQCPEWEYKSITSLNNGSDITKCMSCSDACINCYGPNDSDCKNCAFTNILSNKGSVPKWCNNKTTCVSECPNNTFESNYECHECSDICLLNHAGPSGCVGPSYYLGILGCKSCKFGVVIGQIEKMLVIDARVSIDNTIINRRVGSLLIECLNDTIEKDVCERHGYLDYRLVKKKMTVMDENYDEPWVFDMGLCHRCSENKSYPYKGGCFYNWLFAILYTYRWAILSIILAILVSIYPTYIIITGYKQRRRLQKLTGLKDFKAKKDKIRIPEHTQFLINGENLHYKIDDENLLGEGEYGTVYKGEFTKNEKKYPVAIKILKALPHEQNLSDNEVITMARLDHVHIVQFVGVCMTKDRISVVTDLCLGGSLSDLLTKHGDEMQIEHFLIYCSQIASAMEYLNDTKIHGKPIVHGDLAARNVLVRKPGIVQITDFGLSQILSQDENLTGEKCPLEWSAIELLNPNAPSYCLSEKTDVWSFGVVVWEIMTFGLMPYKEHKLRERGVDIDKRGFLYGLLVNGNRLKTPKISSRDVNKVMAGCWDKKPENRLTFKKLKKEFDSFLRNPRKHIFLNPENKRQTNRSFWDCFKSKPQPKNTASNYLRVNQEEEASDPFLNRSRPYNYVDIKNANKANYVTVKDPDQLSISNTEKQFSTDLKSKNYDEN